MFIFALENEEAEGAYNAVAPNPATNAEFTRQTAKILKKPLILPNVPVFALRMMLGEMASMVTGGSKITPERMLQSGFQFNFDTLEDALKDLLG
jgi:NAD dependent epimerase/dehydratase family enzyme